MNRASALEPIALIAMGFIRESDIQLNGVRLLLDRYYDDPSLERATDLLSSIIILRDRLDLAALWIQNLKDALVEVEPRVSDPGD